MHTCKMIIQVSQELTTLLKHMQTIIWLLLAVIQYFTNYSLADMAVHDQSSQVLSAKVFLICYAKQPLCQYFLIKCF